MTNDRKRDELASKAWFKVLEEHKFNDEFTCTRQLYFESGFTKGYDAAMALKGEKAQARIKRLEECLKHITGIFDGYCKICSEFGLDDDDILRHYEVMASKALKDSE